MARISPNSPRYRTKNEIARDVARVLKSSLHYGTKFAVLKEITWVWTEFNGKFTGCPYWTDAALRRLVRDGNRRRLRHEHVVPKKVVIDMLFGLKKSATLESVRDILDRFLIGVNVTKEEDARLNSTFCKTMPSDFETSRDPWLRYKQCGITVRVMPHQIAAILPFIRKTDGAFSNEVRRRKLLRTLYRQGWIDANFDWQNWPDAERYFELSDKLKEADIFTIQRLLTTHFRKDRFCEGHLEEMFQSGHIFEILKRLKALRKTYVY